ncbi:DUF6731 family protein [Alicyclobacillus dauci]|uniref:Uncharacterized protein n=1 Tax=Alicyclobacillus dauci TaxID=1475485 RepID=A0ABY6Z6W3_9BACL|nr:DUF6731 family protein [Alicyclobacillus dauci]WAH38629.1 hypothetical protein NZD86_09165 [Alicyclobacillus dauci]
MAKDTVRRQVKFDYYRVALRKSGDKPNDKDRLFDLKLWIAKAKALPLKSLTKEYHQEQARMEKATFSKTDGYWFLHFSRLRDTMIPSWATISTNVEPMELEEDEYLGEEITGLYDETNKILMLQRNRNSLSPTGVEAYLNAVWDNHKQHIYLRPILAKDVAQRVKKGTAFRRLTIRFADLDSTSPSSKFKRAKELVDAFRDYAPVNAEVTLTMGRSRNSSLSSETINEVIDEVLKDREGSGIVKAEIGLKESDDSAVEVIDLFEERAQSSVYFDVPKRKSLEHAVVAKAMVKLYNDSRKRIIGYLSK